MSHSIFTKDKLKVTDWNNKDITDYYENVPIEAFRNLAIQGGFEEGCDINLIYPYISQAASLLDVGSGYGRVLGNLLKRNFSGKLYSIERSQHFYDYLAQHYSGQVEIAHSSIQEFQPPQLMDAILWMWSGINDFAKEEQLSILKRISTWLKPNGIFILETLLHTLRPQNASIDTEKQFIICSQHGTIYSYKTSSQEIEDYGKQLGFYYIKHINYQTTTQRQRVLHLLSHVPI